MRAVQQLHILLTRILEKKILVLVQKLSPSSLNTIHLSSNINSYSCTYSMGRCTAKRIPAALQGTLKQY